MVKKYIHTFSALFGAFLFVGSALAQTAQPTDRPDDRAALRAILAKGVEALNSRNFDAITPSLHPNFTIITVDNKKYVGVDAFKSHYLSLFNGPGALLNKLDTSLVVDESTHFLDENTGVVYGTSKDTFYFKDGDVRTMQSRWSALMEKERDGWKLVNVHFSANVLENPVLEVAKSYAKKIAVISGVAGLVLGALLTFFMRRRPGI